MSAPESTGLPPENTYHGDGATVQSPRAALEALRAELRRRWQEGDPVPAEVLFPPDADRGLKLQLIFTELVLREETGRRATADDFRCRLPDLAGDIERQMNLLGMMGGDDLTAATFGPGGASGAAVPVTVPGYEIDRLLGRGGMGVVYLARQVRFNRMVALKVMLAGTQAGDEEVARFRTEAEAIARLNHPGIVQVFDTGEWTPPGGTPLPYFSMEFCPGGSLAGQLKGEPQTPAYAARTARDLALAAHAAHDAGVVHRDLKPANVLLRDGTPKITDFGLAKKLDVDDGHTRSGTVMGTPSYMPPEQAAGEGVGPAADVYALGAVLYEMLVGQPPFKGAGLLET
ncbi:MAG: serine/threonine-protein kinase, partial [Gemmataceae bacterium]